jgi:hypothetical protein
MDPEFQISLSDKQLVHCKTELDQEFKDSKYEDCLETLKASGMVIPIVCHELPEGLALDYSQCLITLEDVSKVGGYSFLKHTSLTGQPCAPVYVLSKDGYAKLLANPVSSVCPVCYAALTAKDFIEVGPKPEVKEQEIFSEDFVAANNIFSGQKQAKVQGPPGGAPVAAYNGGAAYHPVANNGGAAANVQNDQKGADAGTIIVMKGTVGGGKSAFVAELKKQLEEKGYVCTVASFDKWAKQGMVKEAAGLIAKELTEAKASNAAKKVVVVDTCGDQHKIHDVFFHDFSKWKEIQVIPNYSAQDQQGYLAWSLRNVLQRGPSGANTSYWLAPHGYDQRKKQPMSATCVEVHQQKASKHIKGAKQMVKKNLTVEQAIAELNAKADAYAAKLAPVEDSVKEFIQKNGF